MSRLLRAVSPVAFLVMVASLSSGATPKEIEAAIKKGTDALRAQYARGGPGGGGVGAGGNGIGPTCLAGLAMLEGGVPVADPAMKNVTEMIRNASYSQTKTYQVALCLMYLDRYGDPNDVPLIQALAIRLLAGQTAGGGWGYDCISAVTQADEQRLRAMKPVPGPPKLHPEVEKYAQAVVRPASLAPNDDNSNTQFAVIAVWMARKYGVPVDPALDRIEARFLMTQSPRTAGWPYSGPVPGVNVGTAPATGSPAMYCAGIIGLATGVARREERRLKAAAPKEDPKKDPATSKKPSDDPFFNPPKPAEQPKKPAPRPLDDRDRAVQAAFQALGLMVAESAQAGRGALVIKQSGHGDHDLYFLWSLERACVIFGVEKLGGVNWYDAGAHTLVGTQGPNGTWAGGFGADVSTSFAILFLCRANLARDLSGKVQNETSTEMRAGAGPPGTEIKPMDPTAGVPPVPAGPTLPGVSGSESATLAAELVRATDKDWATVLKKLRDSRGSAFTEGLVTAVTRLEGNRLKEAREALAERLTRMTGETLRSMAKADEPELRRASVLAMAMKDDKSHIPDLIASLVDDQEIVVRAAKAGLKSLTSQDFGPANNATIGEKKIAADAWGDWWNKQKKK